MTDTPNQAQNTRFYRDNLGPWSNDFAGRDQPAPRVVRDLRAGVPNGADVIRHVFAICRTNADADLIVAALNATSHPVNAALLEAAKEHIATHPVFKLRPVGQEGSRARLEQLDQIASEDALVSAIAAAEKERAMSADNGRKE